MGELFLAERLFDIYIWARKLKFETHIKLENIFFSIEILQSYNEWLGCDNRVIFLTVFRLELKTTGETRTLIGLILLQI